MYKLFLVVDKHHAYSGDWQAYYLVNAENAQDAGAAVPNTDNSTREITEIDISAPFKIGESDRDSFFLCLKSDEAAEVYEAGAQGG